MSKQPSRRRRATGVAARTVVIGVAVAALVGIVGASQALAGTDERVMEQGMIDRQAATGRQGLAAVAVPDERVMERQGRIDRQKAAASQADEQGKAAVPSQRSPTENLRRYFRPEPQFGGDEPVAPAAASTATAGGQGGLVISLAVAALLLALGAAATWGIRHRRPRHA
jgi:hypothetical protein